MRSMNTGGGGFGAMGFGSDMFTSIILPAQDILKGAQQAPEIKADEKPGGATESSEQD